MLDTETHDVHIAIAGAGLAGLGMAIALRRDGIEDFVVLERADDLGGTWRDNSYPGCACDIASVLYSYSDEQNPGWSHAFARQPEIQAYIHDVAQTHDLAPHLRYGHEVLEASWDEDADRWQIRTTRGDFSAEILISAVGALADPSIPDLPGLDSFSGTVFHSARWNHDHDLTGRRVAVVGTGASAIQFVPEIQPAVGHLDLFQRTPPWVLPRGNPAIPARWRRRFARHPRVLGGLRRSVFSLYEAFHVGFRHPAVMKLAERRARAHIEREVPDPQLRAKLIPDYRLGCKRVLGSDTWYPALTRDNVDVITAGITRVTPDGIVDAEGTHHPADTIIFGTGFHVSDVPVSHRIRGRGGELLADRWQGSPRAHLGIGVSGYPNLFMLLGPNTGLGHNSVLLMIEAQIAYLRRALRYRREHGLATLEPTAEAQAAYVAAVDRGTQGSVWTAGGCESWYMDVTGRNSTLWPGSVRAYQRRLGRFEIGDYAAQLPRPLPEREPAFV
ncbi:MAG TPA: NAD(P)/FAD-dependent oxidoreductase [Solirubrobacteraceae bacterium]|jgi:cation diffusion facilitator CzcD-associated flavoprotein CzcO|nr:NAD(P)/FAD-dependent oxidoreductase [Solirubrobacteraceae bacterium]